MNLILLSTEKNLFIKGSTARLRIEKYNSIAENLFYFVYVPKGSNFKEEKIASNITIYPVESRFKIFGLISSIFKVFNFIKRGKFLAENTLISSQDPFEIGLASWIISLVSGLPLHIQIHVDFFNNFYKYESIRQFIQFYLASFVIRRAKEIRAVSPRIKKYLIERLNILNSKITFIPVYADLVYIRNYLPKLNIKSKYSEFETIILMASRMVKQKYILLAIKAFKNVVKEYPKTGLLLVGSGPEEIHAKELVDNLRLNNNVRFEPWVSSINDYLKTADIFCLSSNYEGYPLVLFEASAAPIAIVTTDVGCAGDYIINNQNGLVVSVGNVYELSQALIKVVKSKELRSQLSKSVLENSVHYMSESDYHEMMKESWLKTLK